MPQPKTRRAIQQGFVGYYFHSLKNGIVEWQGVIVAEPQPGLYLCQLFEWMMGEPSVAYLIKLEEMKDWLFYPDGATMNYSYERGVARGKLGSGAAAIAAKADHTSSPSRS